MADLISVVVPFYFGNRFLEDLLDSIECNSEVIGEVIFLVDNGSDYPEIREPFTVKYRIVASPFRHANGAGLLRPFGFSLARCRFVMFLDPDDFYICSSLREYVCAVRSRNLAFAFAGAHNVDSKGSLIGKYVPTQSEHSLAAFLNKSMTIYSVSVLIDKHQIPALVSTALKKRNDYFAWFHVINFCLENSLEWGSVSIFVVNHRFHSESLTSNKLSSIYWQFVFLRSVNVSLPVSLYLLLAYVINTTYRRFSSGGL